MTIESISDQLVVLQSLNHKQVYELLFNMACSSKEFTKLLELTHFQTIRKRVNKDNASLGTRINGALSLRGTAMALEGSKESFTSEEYFVLFTLVDSLYITSRIREQLKEALSYTPITLLTRTLEKLCTCAVCTYPANKNICWSCEAKLRDFTSWRRDSFTVPINYLNFNIRGSINIGGEFSIRYNDWHISKKQDDKEVVFKLLQALADGVARYEPVLPIVEYQKVIV